MPCRDRIERHKLQVMTDTRSFTDMTGRRERWLNAVADLFRGAGQSILATYERWILWAPVLLGVGVGGYFALPTEPVSWIAPCVFVLSALFVWLGWRSPAIFLTACVIGFIALGVSVAQFKTNLVAAPVLARSYGPAPVTGRVVSLERLPQGPRVVLENVTLRGIPAEETPSRIRLRLHKADRPVVGEILDLFAKLSPPGRPSMPGGYDFQRRFWFMEIGGVGFTLGRARRPEQFGFKSDDSALIGLRRFRQMMSDRIRMAAPGPTGAVSAALITGDRSAIPQTVMSDMRDAGLAHLLAISGLHLGLVATILFFVARALLASHEQIALKWPIKKIAALFALFGTLGYLVLTGGTIPTQRAFLMSGLALVAIMMDRSPFSLRLVAFGAFAILLVSPQALMGASFQMSFAAVVALVAAYEAFGERLRSWIYDGGAMRRASAYLIGVALTTIIASGATGVFAAHQFGRVAYFGLAANLIAVPITAIWVMPWAIVVVLLMPFGLETYALMAMGAGIDVILSVAASVAAWPGAVGLVPTGQASGLVAASLGGLWLCLGRGRWRSLGVAGLFFGAVSGYFVEKPDIMISESGKLAAVRLEDGTFALSSRSRDRFAGRQWLRAAGQDNAALWSKAAAQNARCDNLGCTAVVKGRTVSYLWDSRGISEDCTHADIVIAAVPIRQSCSAQNIDRFDTWRNGAYAVYLTDKGVVMVNVVQRQGVRPWSTVRRTAGPRLAKGGKN